MSKKPIIGINCDFRPDRKDASQLSWINGGYYESVTQCGGVPMIIPPLVEDDDLRQILQNVDGLVMVGCKLDLDPIRLGLEKHPMTRIMPARREDFDRRLASIAFEMKIPVLAIGSGMHTMNVVCGGTLFQHLTEDVAKSLPHRDSGESNLRHVLDIVPGTHMDAIYGPGEIRVNSDHHMSVDMTAPIFRVSATTPDGIIEAYESTMDNWYCLGVQFHPESGTASALDMQVFESFLDACKEETPAILSMPARRAA